ncbi:hypothetical protein ABZ869_17440 [Streptomyces sp. NPDC046928]|uniref:hypothetical protein n=1 Tax=Streptomyces sp. NPDC046928 TaxID=3155021 RepID=UPI0033E094EF
MADFMKVTRNGYVLELENVMDALQIIAGQCRNPAHTAFVTAAITALEEEGAGAAPLLNGCPQATPG